MKVKAKGEPVQLPIEQDAIYNIKINRETQKFYIDDENLDYGEFDEFNIRVLDTYNKLKVYNQTTNKTDVESTFFKFSGDSRDSQGSHVVGNDGKTLECCGRVIPTELTKKMTEEAQKENKEKAKWYTYAFGIVSISGKSPVLCDFQLSGASIKSAGDILKKIKEDKKDYHKVELKFKAFNNPTYDWPDIEITADFSQDLPVSGLEPYFDTIRAYVDEHNDNIDVKAAKYKKYGGKPYKPNKFVKKKY